MRDGCIVLPPRRVALSSSVQAVSTRLQPARAILGACHPSGRDPTPLRRRPADRRGRRPDARRRPRPGARARARHRRARPGRRSCQGGSAANDRPLARPARGASRRSSARSGATPPAARSSRRVRADGVTRPGRPRRRAPGPGGSGSSSRPAASARSWPTAAPPTGSRPTTSSRTGSPAPTPLHLPVYSLLGEPLGERRPAGDRARRGPRARSSASTLRRSARSWRVAGGRRGSWSAKRRRTSCSRPRPRRRRCSAGTASRVCSSSRRVAVVKRGREGRHRPGPRRRSSACASRSRRDRSTAADTTGAGDAFDAGFLVGWFGAIAAGRALPATLRQAAVAGHRAAARQLSSPRTELGARVGPTGRRGRYAAPMAIRPSATDSSWPRRSPRRSRTAGPSSRSNRR